MNDPSFAPLPSDFDYENAKVPEGSSYAEEVRETAETSKAISRSVVREAMDEGANMAEAAAKAAEALDQTEDVLPQEVPSAVPPVDLDDDDII